MSDEAIKRAVLDSIRALMIIRAYRIRGHLAADLDPLEMYEKTQHPELDPKSYGFTEADMDRPIFIDNVLGCRLRPCARLSKSYRVPIAALLRCNICIFPILSSPLGKERIEGSDKEIRFTREGRKAILNKMVEAEGFEKFLHVKYMGTKRFGLDGGSLIPALEQIIKRGGALGVKEIVIGMPHRGRLSVLQTSCKNPIAPFSTNFRAGRSNPKMSMDQGM